MSRAFSPATVGTSMVLLTGAPALAWWYLKTKKEWVMPESVQRPACVKFIKDYRCLEAMRHGCAKLELRMLARMIWR
jgi:hypothetical protein